VEVLFGQKHWLSVAEGNCVAERRGGEQPEANYQSVIKTKMNSIRPDVSASLLAKGEAWNRKLTRKGSGNFGDLSIGETVCKREGYMGWLETEW